MKKLTLTTLTILLFIACDNESLDSNPVILDLPETPFEYFNDNDQATLGRVLFYDAQLSVNNAISCASCHKQGLAFADNKAFSLGFDSRNSERNSMPIQNIGFFSAFDSRAITVEPDSAFVTFDSFIAFPEASGLFWDGRGINPSTSLLLPIVNHVEMGIPDLDYLVNKLEGIEYYPELFEKAFGEPVITADNIGWALNAFIMNIQSHQTRFDLSFHEGSQGLSAKESLGKELFFSTYDCNSCHQVQNPSGYLFAGGFSNIGLDKVYDDNGFSGTTTNPDDIGKFKIPSLRNVSLTGPYMHDGRFGTLEEVINHYSTGVENHPNLDERLLDENGEPIRFEITDQEVSAIVAFLGALTDHEMISDERLSNPFRQD